MVVIVLTLLSTESLVAIQKGETAPKKNPASSWSANPGVSENDSFNPWFFRLAYHSSSILQSNNFVKGENTMGAPLESGQGFKIEFGWQSNGSEDWEQSYNFPAIGLGFDKTDFGSEELGSPVAIYSFFSWPLVRWNRAILATEFNLGAAFNWTPYDPDSNPFNSAVSTPITFYTGWGWFIHYTLATRLELTAGGAYTHYSNGGLRYPNDGLNTLALVGGMRYNFDQTPLPLVRRDVAPFNSFNELVVAAAGGTKKTNLPTSERFSVANLTLTYQKQFYSMGKIAAGIDWTYDESANARIEFVEEHLRGQPLSSSKNSAIGIYGGYEHVVGRFSVPIQIGYYVWHGHDDNRTPKLYQRLGLRYRLSPHIFVGFSVRFLDLWNRRARSDFIECTVGLSFPKK